MDETLNSPKKSYGRDVALAGTGLLLEFLAVTYGAYWLAIGAAVFLWLAIHEYAKAVLALRSPAFRIGTRVLSACLLTVTTIALVRGRPFMHPAPKSSATTPQKTNLESERPAPSQELKPQANKRRNKPSTPPASVTPQSPPVQINAQNGIGISGGTVTNPTVNNYAPPPPNIVASPSPSEPQTLTSEGAYKTRVTIKTDRETDHLSFRLAFDRPFLKAEVSLSYKSTIAYSSALGEMNGHPALEFSVKDPSILPINGDIYVILFSNEPLNLLAFERGL